MREALAHSMTSAEDDDDVINAFMRNAFVAAVDVVTQHLCA